jgi:hypothetical protein
MSNREALLPLRVGGVHSDRIAASAAPVKVREYLTGDLWAQICLPYYQSESLSKPGDVNWCGRSESSRDLFNERQPPWRFQALVCGCCFQRQDLFTENCHLFSKVFGCVTGQPGLDGLPGFLKVTNSQGHGRRTSVKN